MLQFAFGQLGVWQILVVLCVFLLFFGSNRLPKMARSLGSSLTEFKKGLRGEPDDDDDEDEKKIDDGEKEKDKSSSDDA